jgi:copper resistance protein C
MNFLENYHKPVAARRVSAWSAAVVYCRPSSRLARILVCIGSVLFAAATPERASAHAIVVRTSPPQGGVGAEDISKVDVWYDAGIRDAFAALAVVSASGERVDKRDAAIDGADPAHVSVSVNRLTPGKYTVRYRALSADGHLVSGAWEFEVRPEGPVP